MGKLYFGGSSFNGDEAAPLTTIRMLMASWSVLIPKLTVTTLSRIVGAAAEASRGDTGDRTGRVDRDSQSAYIYSSARFRKQHLC